MKRLDNGILSIQINDYGAELRTVIKNGWNYLWTADEKVWKWSSPLLFPIVGKLANDTYTHNGKKYKMASHGFARPNPDFELAGKTKDSISYILRANEKTRECYPFEFALKVTYTLIDNKVKVNWEVTNEGETNMPFSIGAHPAFTLKEGKNYFKFDSENDISYNHLDPIGMNLPNVRGALKNEGGYAEIKDDMFDVSALIVEGEQAKEISICDENKNAYVTVRFSAPLFGLWSLANTGNQFVCIEPWYGRADGADYKGEFSEREYMMSLPAGETFRAEYEIEFN